MLSFDPPAPRQVLVPEIAARVKQALVDIVEAGTARRLHGAFRYGDKAPLLVGAKTGTGDNRKKYFARGGQLVREEVVNRTATVVFFIGDAFFGNLTVYVPGPAAADFGFTSSLPAQLLSAMAPALQPLLDTDAAANRLGEGARRRVRPRAPPALSRAGASAGRSRCSRSRRSRDERLVDPAGGSIEGPAPATPVLGTPREGNPDGRRAVLRELRA